jgi:uncharacterized protein YecE (DUF72 family)
MQASSARNVSSQRPARAVDAGQRSRARSCDDRSGSRRGGQRWLEARAWVGKGREVHVYFDNTDAGHAVTDATILRDLLRG